MQRRRLKNLKENIDGTWKMWRSKSAKKECSNEENFQEDSRQRCYMDGQTSNTTRNIGEGWKGIRGDGRAKSQQEKGQ